MVIRSCAALLGLGTIGLGLWFYDWRLNCIAVGAVLLALSITGEIYAGYLARHKQD